MLFKQLVLNEWVCDIENIQNVKSLNCLQIFIVPIVDKKVRLLFKQLVFNEWVCDIENVQNVENSLWKLSKMQPEDLSQNLCIQQ